MSISYKYVQELHQQVLRDMDGPCNNAQFQDFTTVFSRDESMGLGMQIHEFKGRIFVHAISCMDGTWLDSIEAVNSFLERSAPVGNNNIEVVDNSQSLNSLEAASSRLLLTSSFEPNTQESFIHLESQGKDMDSSFSFECLGPAGSAGILPGDCIVGVHGQSFHSLTKTSTSLLSSATQWIRESKDPIILHVRRYNADPFTLFHGDYDFDSVDDMERTLALSDNLSSNPHSNSSIVMYPEYPQRNADDVSNVQPWTGYPNLSPHYIHHPHHPRNTSARFIQSHKKGNEDHGTHPFVRLLVQKGIVRGEDESHVMTEFQRITERAQLWESMQDARPPLYSPSFDDPMPNQSFTSSSSSVLLYPVAKYRQIQATRLERDLSVIQSGFNTINKALSIRIVDSFLDGEKLAYTIWVYDVEKREEWYAPIRYTHDFVELREVTSRMSKHVEKIDFPSSGWFSSFSSIEVSESQNSRDARCSRLEAFLRDLFKAIYLHPLTPNSAEIALYVQTFLGVDSCKERLVHFSPKYNSNDKMSIDLDIIRSRLLVTIQLYVYRIFLLGAVSRLVDAFMTDIRGSFGSSSIVRDDLEKTLRKVKSFLHQLQVLIFDGCIHDFRAMIACSEYSILVDSSPDEKQFVEDALFLEAIRSQVEVEVYIPLRSLISKDLTNLWREDDIEILRKINVLKKQPQSYFISQDYESPSNWKAVSEIITIGLARQSLPCIKLNSLVNAGVSIPRLFEFEQQSNESKSFSADDMLPIFIYAVVHAEIDRPHALCALLRNVCDPSTEIVISTHIRFMTMKIERIFADVDNFMVVIEYHNQAKGSAVTYEKIYVDELDTNSDLIQLADDIIHRYDSLSEHWRNEVIDALYDLQSNISSKKVSYITPTAIKSDLNIEESLSRIVESVYGKESEKLSGLSSLLQICKNQRHLDIVIRHRSLMPALARMLDDDCGDNIALVSIIVQIIASLSVFADFHRDLIHNHIGLSIMTLLKNQINRIKSWTSEITIDHIPSSGKPIHSEVVLLSLSVLDHLSDDPSICRKMLRKGLIALLFECLDINSSNLSQTASKLLLKTSIYEELILLSSDNRSFKHLLQLLKARDETVQRNAVLIFYNMSFFERFHQVVPIHDVTKEVFRMLHRSINLRECFSLLYQWSRSKENRLSLALPEYIDHIMGLLLQCQRQKYATVICAIVIHISLEPRCAELIICHVGAITTLLQDQIDGKLYQWVCVILYQLSRWTRAFQTATAKMCRESDEGNLTQYVTDPMAFASPSRIEGSDQVSSIYKHGQYWGKSLITIIKIARIHLHDGCLKQLLATIANMTEHDLPQGCTWYDMYFKHELLDLLLGLTYNGPIRNDILFEVAAIYRRSCMNQETASLLSTTRILAVLHQMMEGCAEDNLIHVHFLLTCQAFLQFHSTRSLLLSDNGIYGAIFETMKSENDKLYQEAERCIELIILLDKDENGGEGKHAETARAQFFEYYNREWLKAFQNLVESPVIHEAES